MAEKEDNPKLCKDCHWCSQIGNLRDWDCGRSDADGTNLLGGTANKVYGNLCYFERSELGISQKPDACGPEGKHWKAKHVGKSCNTCGWLDEESELCDCPAITEDGDPDCVDYEWANWKPKDAITEVPKGMIGRHVQEPTGGSIFRQAIDDLRNDPVRMAEFSAAWEKWKAKEPGRCGHCGGTGKIQPEVICVYCRGSGRKDDCFSCGNAPEHTGRACPPETVNECQPTGKDWHFVNWKPGPRRMVGGPP